MEVCEDMAVHMEMANMRKRQYVEDIGAHPNNKRICKGLESIANGNGILLNPVNDCNTVYWQMQISPDKAFMQELVSESDMQLSCAPFHNHESGGSSQPCQRCMAGESGHINHILGI
ncbi:uncharacterized protein C10orf143 homolog [Ascaphus truei]|uniref:uncharacterized protein C10orf143 homolog n=1 Tax=Ascaphus truei TaxID=8439 RepID=UPI003F5A9178